MFIYSINDIPQNSKICVYGKGLRSEQLKDFLKLFRKDVEIVCFIDSSDLDDFLKIKKEYDFIVISSVFWKEIKKTLDEYKICNYKILTNEFVDFIKRYLNHKELNEKYASKLPEVLEIFKLEQHKNLYKFLYDYRTDNQSLCKMMNYNIENPDNIKNSYLEFLIKDKIETLVDAGVFDGVTTRKFTDTLKNLKNVFGFEPLKDKLNFNYSEIIDIKNLANFKIYPEGLWNKSKTLGFSIHEGGSAITEDKDSLEKIETISLDEIALKENYPKIDFIKMDIENAELNALKGGINRIKKDRPQIAVCIYHSFEQFIEVPLFLKSNLENYSFYLGHYSCHEVDTILYAIPRELEN